VRKNTKSNKLSKSEIFAKKYIYIATKKPVFFYTFLFLGAALFLWLTFTTNIDTADGKRTLFEIIFINAGKGL